MNSTTTQLRKRREQRRVRKTEDEWNAYKEENGLTIQKKRKKYEIRNNLRQKILR
jgi:hypothetical protein